MPARYDFLGCPVDAIDLPGMLDWTRRTIAEGRPRRIMVVNANKLYLMARNPEVRAIVTSSDLIIPEWAVVWGARRLGNRALVHTGGLIYAQQLLPYAATEGLRPFFLGGRPEVVAQLVETARRQNPALEVAGSHHGYLTTPEVEKAALDAIAASKPDVLLVAMGSPKQELWIARQVPALGVPVSIGVGGTFDVLAGLKADTPNWARGRGLEWLYRLAHDPRAYWRRYLTTNSWFVAQVAGQWVRGKRVRAV